MNTYTKWIIVAVVAVAVAIGASPLIKGSQSNGETMKIGAAMALTGDAASWGEMSLKGAQIAVDELNAKGGIKGKKVELVVEDMKSSSQGSISAVQKLLSIDHVSAILGPSWMDVYQGAQGIVAGKNVLLVSPDAGAEAVNTPKVNENVFSTWYRSQPKAELVVRFLVSQNIKRLDIVHQNDSYYVDFGRRLEESAKKNGITVVRHEVLTGGDTDFKTLMIKLKSDDPDMIFFALYDQKAVDAFFKNHTQLASSVPMITDEAGQDYAQDPSMARAIDGMHFLAARWDPVFESKFKAAYEGLAPRFGASTGYDSLMIIADALEHQPDNLAGYVKSHAFKTVTFGDMRFDGINGVITNNETYAVKRFKDGTVTVLN